MLDEAFTKHHIPHIFKTYQGGHSESLWRQQAPLWLGLALNHLAGGRAFGGVVEGR